MTQAVFLFKVIFTFIATEIDDFLVFVLLYGRHNSKKEKLVIFAAQLFVLILTTAACGFVASLLSNIPAKYLRLLGIIPIAVGMWNIIEIIIPKLRERENKDGNESDKKTDSKSPILFFSAFAVVIASSGDNLGIYIPFFVGMTIFQKILCLAIFTLLQFFWSYMQIKTATIPLIQKIILKAGKILQPAVFILLGTLILLGL